MLKRTSPRAHALQQEKPSHAPTRESLPAQQRRPSAPKVKEQIFLKTSSAYICIYMLSCV